MGSFSLLRPEWPLPVNLGDRKHRSATTFPTIKIAKALRHVEKAAVQLIPFANILTEMFRTFEPQTTVTAPGQNSHHGVEPERSRNEIFTVTLALNRNGTDKNIMVTGSENCSAIF